MRKFDANRMRRPAAACKHRRFLRDELNASREILDHRAGILNA
jgi:hypothetical protein